MSFRRHAYDDFGGCLTCGAYWTDYASWSIDKCVGIRELTDKMRKSVRCITPGQYCPGCECSYCHRRAKKLAKLKEKDPELVEYIRQGVREGLAPLRNVVGLLIKERRNPNDKED